MDAEMNAYEKQIYSKMGEMALTSLFIRNVIEKMKKRPALFLGYPGISRLQSYLHGYCAALSDFQLTREDEALFPLPFHLFHGFVANKYGFGETTIGWCNMILQKCSADEENALYTFFDLYDEFFNLKMQSCWMTVFDRRNIDYHNTAFGVCRILVNTNPRETEPLFKDPLEAFIVELTGDAGYIYIVHTKKEYLLDRNIYRLMQECKSQLQRDFGELRWQEISADRVNAAINTVRIG